MAGLRKVLPHTKGIMNSHKFSRLRKQQLRCRWDRDVSLQESPLIDSNDAMSGYVIESSPPRKRRRFFDEQGRPSEIRDRQAQIDHNEQERVRRRELAIAYELIRACISREDIELYLGQGSKALDRLSYPMILELALYKVMEEIHDYRILDNIVALCDQLEEACLERGIRFNRGPRRSALMKRHKIIANVVQETLMNDKV